MTVTVVTKPPPLSTPRLKTPQPTILAEFAEWLTIHRAGHRPVRVLLITGVKPHFVMHAEIRRKPGAMQIETECKNWHETLRCVEKFCAVLDDTKSKAYATGVRHKAVVIINDADCFVAHSASEGLFTRTCDKELMSRVEKMRQLVEASGGEVILMAVLQPDSTELWRKKCEELGWDWKTESHLLGMTAWHSIQKELASVNEQASDKEQPPVTEQTSGKVEVPNAEQADLPSASKWYHGADEKPPPEFIHGPFTGELKELAALLYADKKSDYRRVQRKIKSKAIWVRKLDDREYQMWFKDEILSKEAEARQPKGKNP